MADSSCQSTLKNFKVICLLWRVCIRKLGHNNYENGEETRFLSSFLRHFIRPGEREEGNLMKDYNEHAIRASFSEPQ